MNINEEGVIQLYGIYDTKDNCWLGDEYGPKRFDDFMLARVAAQVVEDQVFGTDLGGRFRAKEIPTDSFTLRDKLQLKTTPEESLSRIENKPSTDAEPIVISFRHGKWQAE